MELIETSLPGVIEILPKVHGDSRGFFLEVFRQDTFRESGIELDFVQSNHSRSERGVLRGLHYQLEKPQGKLVRVTRGVVYDVAVDVRLGSPTFGHWYGAILDDESMRMMYVPPDYAHGFVVLSEVADFLYQCTDYYHPQSEQGILWNDPDLDIEWPDTTVKLSEKDKLLPRLADQARDKLPVYSG